MDKSMLAGVVALVLVGHLGFAADPGTPEPAAGTNKPAAAPTAQKFTNLTVPQFARMAADKHNIVLDVRTAKEFAAGHLPGARNLDVNAEDFEKKAAALDKSKTYLVHCAAGARSMKACAKLAHLDFPKLYNLPGGFYAWKKAGEPVEK